HLVGHQQAVGVVHPDRVALVDELLALVARDLAALDEGAAVPLVDVHQHDVGRTLARRGLEAIAARPLVPDVGAADHRLALAVDGEVEAQEARLVPGVGPAERVHHAIGERFGLGIARLLRRGGSGEDARGERRGCDERTRVHVAPPTGMTLLYAHLTPAPR